MEQSVKVSVIVPCYNSGKYIKNSVYCLLTQYYNNIEIICVNVGSTDNTAEVLEELAAANENIKVITLEENRGLFNARIVGADNASGDYIAFMDSDDTFTPGLISALADKAVESGADLVLSDYRRKSEHRPGGTSYYNFEPLHLEDIQSDGKEMLDKLMRMHGLCPHYQFFCGKFIRRDLWQNCLDDLKTFLPEANHYLAGEEAAATATLFLHALKVRNIHNDCYICAAYKFHSAKYSDSVLLAEDINFTDNAFRYLEALLKKYECFNKYSEEYLMYKQGIGFNYLSEAEELQVPKKKLDYIKETFALNNVKNERRVQSRFYSSLVTETSPIYSEYQHLLKLINSDEIKVVSFDIFDTLVLRPFGIPRDIFVYLNKAFNEEFATETFVDFSSQRRAAEVNCRDVMRALNGGRAESNLSEIYNHIAKIYGYDRDKLEKIKQLEMENEVRFSYPRKFAVKIFNLAVKAGKRVILASDMYLPRECIVKILEKCGIEGYEKLYISNELRINKNTGMMYPYILHDLGSDIKPSEVLHIGDRWGSDVKRPRSYGIQAVHLPATIDLFKAENPGIYTGAFFNKIFKTGDRYHDMMWAYDGFTGVRSLCAMVANMVYDCPYVSFNKNSDLNADPRFIGCFALGMHIYAVARWLIENTRGKGYRKIHFAARDGYLIKKAYDILSEGEEGLPESAYIRISRKSFAIADIHSLADIHSIVHKLNFLQQSPDSIYELFLPVMSDASKAEYQMYRDESKGLSAVKFTDRAQFDMFMTNFYNKYLKDAHFAEYQAMLKKYFGEQFKENDVLFDIGYSGRIELALNKLLGFRIISFYIHTNHDVIVRRNQVSDFHNSTFYNYKPPVSGIIREHLISEMCPSTIGYKIVGDKFEPVFDEYDVDYPTQVITQTIQQYAVKFVRNVKEIFGKDALGLACRLEDISRPLEYYLHYSRSVDRQIFANSEFEDDFGEGHACSILDYWNKALGRITDNMTVYKEPAMPSSVKKRSRLMRALYLFLFDRKTFNRKLKNKLHKK